MKSITSKLKVTRSRRLLGTSNRVARNMLVGFLIFFSATSFSTEYFLAPNGKDQNAGTKSHPWHSLQKSIWKLKPGDTLIIREGTYRETAYAELSTFLKDKWTTLKSAPGEKVVFDGRLKAEEVIEGNWTQESSIWKNKFNKKWDWIDGLWVDAKFYPKVEKEKELKAGTWWHPKKSDNLVIHFEEGKDPHKSKIEFRLEAMVTVSSPYWIIEGITANYYNLTGIGAWNTHHVIIRNNEAHYNGGSGIESNQATDLLIEKNHTSYNGSEGGPGWASGIHLFELTSPKNVLRNNISHHNWDPSPHHTDGNGFSIDKGYAKGGAEVYNNLAHNNGGRGMDVMENSNVKIHHNTFFNNSLDSHMSDQGEICVYGKASSVGLEINDNILLATRSNPPLVVWKDVLPTAIFSDYNLYFNLDTPSLAVSERTGPTKNLSLKEWQEASKQDLHSLQKDPLLKDMKPSKNSPVTAAGSGKRLPENDVYGKTRQKGKGTIGAIESVLTQ